MSRAIRSPHDPARRTHLVSGPNRAGCSSFLSASPLAGHDVDDFSTARYGRSRGGRGFEHHRRPAARFVHQLVPSSCNGNRRRSLRRAGTHPPTAATTSSTDIFFLVAYVAPRAAQVTRRSGARRRTGARPRSIRLKSVEDPTVSSSLLFYADGERHQIDERVELPGRGGARGTAFLSTDEAAAQGFDELAFCASTSTRSK